MIKKFRHKGLEKIFVTGSAAGIQAKHKERLALILSRLDDAEEVEDVNFPGSGLHALKGDRKGLWAVKVSGNWRLVFSMEKGQVYDVDYLDYH